MAFQLHKNRTFSTYINDTFQFFKIHGKNYFKNYFIINGGLLLALIVLVFFGFKFYFETVFSNLNLNGAGFQANQVENIMDNSGFIVIFCFLAILLFFFISAFQYAFPVIYLDLFSKKDKTDLTTSEILDGLKSKSFKIFKFFLAIVFLIVPLVIIIFWLNLILIFLIIGIPLFFVTIPATMSWINISFYNYLSSNDRLFTSFSIGFKYLKQQFWAIVGSTLVMFVIIQTVMTIFTMIPYVLGMASFLTDFAPQSGTINSEKFSTVTMLMTTLMVVSLVANYILANLIIVNQGLIYYSQKEADENTSTNNSIDLIGTDSE